MKLKFTGIRNKILALLLTLSLAPLGAFTAFVYYSYTNTLQKNTISETVRSLEQSDSLVYSKIWGTQQAAKRFCKNEHLINAFSTGNITAETDYTVSEILNESSIINGVAVFTDDGLTYSVGVDTGGLDFADFTANFGRITRTGGTLQWLTDNSYRLEHNNSFFVGTLMRISDGRYAAVYFLLDSSVFEEMTKTTDDAIILVCDEMGKVLFSNREKLNNLWSYSISIHNKIYQNPDSCFKEKAEGKDVIVMKHKSPFTGWYIVKIEDLSVFKKDINSILFTALLIAFLIVILITVIYFVSIRHLFSPINDIVKGMEEISRENFDVHLKTKTNDEFKLISDGFNRMSRKIRNLIESRVKDEREKAEAEFMALRYQINPHFLYNILGMMRLSALQKGERDIADMMLRLNRLFRNCLKTEKKSVTVTEDFEMLRDYIYLINMRYENKINFIIDINDNAKNCLIPSMLLQPLIENAVMHGVSDYIDSAERIPTVKLSAVLALDKLVISVYDNGKGMTSEKIKSVIDAPSDAEIGVRNIYQRLRLHFGDNFGFDIKSSVDEYTHITISVQAEEKS